MEAIRSKLRRKDFIFLIRIYQNLSKRTDVPDAELESPATLIVVVGFNRNAIIQTQRAEMRDVQTHADTPIIVVKPGFVVLFEAERILVHQTNVIERGKA